MVPSEKARPCVSAAEVDNTQTITVLGVSYVPALALARQHRGSKLFSSERTGGVVCEVRESGRALRSAL